MKNVFMKNGKNVGTYALPRTILKETK